MALNRYNPNNFFGFDDNFFRPFLTRNDDPFDLMPVIPSLDRGTDMSLIRASPGYEITESEGKYQIHVDVPGVRREDINVELTDDNKVIHISGGRKIHKDNQVSEARFDKRFTIGDNVDLEKMTANLDNGVLTLTAPKVGPKEPARRKIAIAEGPFEEKKDA